MSKTNWTNQQLDAISTKYLPDGSSCNILVGAAAGSGKTAVLVERIIRKLIPDNLSDSIPIDRLLVVTFTNAAAREMEDRISAALSAELEKANMNGDAPRRKLIKNQQLLLSGSDITTIDAFCMKLIRSHFNLLDIDPGFSPADSGAAELLSDEAMEEVFSELYESGNDDFIRLLCLYASPNSDDGLAALVKHIYNFTRSVPYPEKWLREKTEALKYPDGIQNSEWFKKGFSICRRNIDAALNSAKKGLAYMIPNFSDEDLPANPPEKGTDAYDEWKSYYAAFYSDYLFFRNLLAADFESASKAAMAYEFPRLSALRSKNDEEKERLKHLRASVKENFAEIKLFLSISFKDTSENSKNSIYPVIKALADLTEKYSARFMQKKLSKNILEFSDIEQLSVRLLSENPDVCEEIRNAYDEILMDEYQDTSALQEEIFKHITNGSNLFMVGDMKQSIYRFRSSDPSLFKAKSDEYIDKAGAKNRKILLSKNFRSRCEVLESVNDFFSAVMSEQAGELDYDAEQRLYTGNTSYQSINKSYKSECHIIEMPPSDIENEEEDLSRPVLEARFTAMEINRLKKEHFQVLDNGKYRDIENRDIVILMSSYKSSADIYTAELNEAGIECYAESEGYFEKNEIRIMLSLYKIINNPYCDIPLLGILRSPIGGFTDDELAVIRSICKGRFYTALKEIIQQNKQGLINDNEYVRIAKKAENFHNNLTRWREYSRYMSSDRLTWTLYEETDFYAFCGAMHNGDEAVANLRLLYERAKQYESNGFCGLFNFTKYIERLKNRETDLSSAKLIGEGHNVVRIMTIHKSKGLEFPVVFVNGGSKRFNRTSNEPRLLLHKDLGIAADYIDFENGYRCETPEKSVFKTISAAEQTSEEIRKLYVAMTRAKEKLYFVAAIPGGKTTDSVSKSEEYLAQKDELLSGCDKIPPSVVLSAASFADWVVPVALHSDNWGFFVHNSQTLHICSQNANISDKTENASADIDVENLLNYEYPYQNITSLPSKLSVSDIKGTHLTPIKPKPDFMADSDFDGAHYGTVIHSVLEHLVPYEGMDDAYVKECIADLTEKTLLTPQEAATVSPLKILDFYSSSLGKRIIAAKNVYREQQFEVEIPANILYPDLADSDESILMQGIIDCYFEENDYIVLVDYKTDYYRDVSEIHKKYDSQLEMYAYALEKITQKKVKFKYIYLFYDNSVV